MRRLGTGEAWAVGAALSYAAQTLTLRAAAVDVNAVFGAIVMAGPTFVAMTILVLMSPRRRNQWNPRSESFLGPGTLALVAAAALVSYAVGNTLWVTSMALGGVTVAAPATQSVAVWSALMGILVLREGLSPRMVAGLAVFVVGIAALGAGRALVAGVPGSPNWALGLPAGLAAALCWSVANVVNRSMMLRGADRFVVLGTSITFGLLGLNASLLFGGSSQAYAHTPTSAYLILLLAGLFNVTAQVSLISALSLTRVATVSVITSTASVLTPLAGALLFNDPLNLIMAAGIVLVISGALLVQTGKATVESDSPVAQSLPSEISRISS